MQGKGITATGSSSGGINNNYLAIDKFGGGGGGAASNHGAVGSGSVGIGGVPTTSTTASEASAL